MDRLPVWFISHGGGPWPWMPQARPVYARLAAELSGMLAGLGRLPSAILMVSAHWEMPGFTVQSSPRPPMLYDYYGFPPQTYAVQYAAPGSPVLAARVRELLTAAGIGSADDPDRGFDHGTFSPMQLIRPQADVPVVQMSLRDGLDPAEHLRAGAALAALRDEDVLIVGSGLSYHNLRAFGAAGAQPSRAFGDWLVDAVTGHTGAARERLLADWAGAPAARLAHPREEHLLPLMVAAGAAHDDVAVTSYHETAFMGALTVSNFRFGPLPGAAA